MLLIHLSYQIMAESEEELKSLLMKVKEESEKADLKLNIQKTKIMASSPITSWRIGREDVETMSDFILFSSKITAGGDCSHKIKRLLLLERKAMTNLDSIFKKQRHHFPDKSESEVIQSCLALCNPLNWGLPGSSVHGIFQTRVLEWVAISFSRGSSQPRD